MSDSHPNLSRDSQPPSSGAFALINLANGTSHPLKAGRNAIGRSSKCDIVLEDHATSRRHCVVMVHDSGECEVCDAESRNGTTVNGRRVGWAHLAPGDILGVDGYQLALASATSAAPTDLSFRDETLGVVVWNARQSCWHFSVRLATGVLVPAIYLGTESTPLANDPGWEGVRACLRWLQFGEATVRIAIGESANKQYPGRLRQIIFAPTPSATLVYDRTHHAICVTVNAAGEFLFGPKRVEKGVDFSNHG